MAKQKCSFVIDADIVTKLILLFTNKELSSPNLFTMNMQMRTNVEGPMNADDRACLFPTAEEKQIAVDMFFFRQLLPYS